MREIIIPGRPIAKNRPRFAIRYKGKKGDPNAKAYSHTYFDQETEEGRMMNFIRASFSSTPLEGPVVLSVIFNFTPPKSMSKRRREELLANPWCMHQKDTDNLLKFLMDAANGILWHDDRQVVLLSGVKLYAEQESTVLRVGPAKVLYAPRITTQLPLFSQPLEEVVQLPLLEQAAQHAEGNLALSPADF